ncbi:MAG: hypothetical protein GXP23_05955 [Gammaproteobacteria bacterium]|nr:hypothetical protein [Gammaproteobacteria bacterium]
MKRLTGIFIALALSTSVLAGLAYAQDNVRGLRGPTRLVQNLDLTATQQQNFDVLVEKLRSKRKEMQRKRQTQREEMLALLDSRILDQEKAHKLIEDKARAVEKNLSEMIATIAIFTDSLTTTQKQQLKENIRLRAERIRQRIEQNSPTRHRGP